MIGRTIRDLLSSVPEIARFKFGHASAERRCPEKRSAKPPMYEQESDLVARVLRADGQSF